MRTDQRQDNKGQFTQRRGHEEQGRLECVISCKVDEHDLRRFAVLFDQCRKQFGWQTMSDMYRNLIQEGYRDAVKKVHHPTEQMLRMARMAEEIERIEQGAYKHSSLDYQLDRVHQSIETAWQAGDLEEVRKQLAEFQEKTGMEKDGAVKARRTMEWERRYVRIWDGINRNMSLDPKDFTLDED